MNGNFNVQPGFAQPPPSGGGPAAPPSGAAVFEPQPPAASTPVATPAAPAPAATAGAGGPGSAAADDTANVFSIFVGDLGDVNDFQLQEAFRQFYPSVRAAKVITDPATGRSRGYGFVRFASEDERNRALEMQGYVLCGRPIRVSLATARRNAGGGGGGGGGASANAANAAPHPADLDPTNTTLFIGGLSGGVAEDQLRAIFGAYGEIVYTKVPAGKGCGFVQFVERPAAEMAMASLNGQLIGATPIRISWGRSTSRTRGGGGGGGGGGAANGGGGGGGGGGAFGGPAGGFGADPSVYGMYSGFPGFPAGGMPGAPPFAGGAFGLPAGAAALSMLSAANPAAAAALAQQFGAISLGPHNPYGAAPGAAANGGGAPGGVGGGGGPFGGGQGGFDPAAPPDVARMNAAFAARQQLMLGGGAFMLPQQPRP